MGQQAGRGFPGDIGSSARRACSSTELGDYREDLLAEVAEGCNHPRSDLSAGVLPDQPLLARDELEATAWKDRRGSTRRKRCVADRCVEERARRADTGKAAGLAA